MDSAAGLNNATTGDLVMGVFYGITAVTLLVTAYVLYIKRFKRQKMEAVDTVNFVTAKYNIYKEKTQLLVEVPTEMRIKIMLLDANEKLVSDLLISILKKGEHIINFDPANYENGSYFLKMEAPTTQILKKIVINK